MNNYPDNDDDDGGGGDAACIQVVRGPAVMSVGLQPLLSAAAAPTIDDSNSHFRSHGHCSQSSLPQVRLRQQDVY